MAGNLLRGRVQAAEGDGDRGGLQGEDCNPDVIQVAQAYELPEVGGAPNVKNAKSNDTDWKRLLRSGANQDDNS